MSRNGGENRKVIARKALNAKEPAPVGPERTVIDGLEEFFEIERHSSAAIPPRYFIESGPCEVYI